jgi:6-phosphofructokinase 2
MSHSVVTVTLNPTIDVAYAVDRLVPDDKLVADRPRRDPGGGGVNVSRALRRLGVESTAFVVAGGSTGDELAAHLDAEGVTTVVHRVDPATRESVTVHERSTGHEYRIVVEGEPIDDAAAVAAVLDASCGAEIVVLSGLPAAGMPAGVWAGLVGDLSPAWVVVDTFGRFLPPVFESAAAVVKPSRRELELAVDRPLVDEPAIEGAAREVLGRGEVGALVVSMGDDGAFLVPRDAAAVRVEAPLRVAARSTVGCGDALVAGIVAARVAGHELDECVRWGVAAGTATAAIEGTSFPDRRAVEAVLKEVIV